MWVEEERNDYCFLQACGSDLDLMVVHSKYIEAHCQETVLNSQFYVVGSYCNIFKYSNSKKSYNLVFLDYQNGGSDQNTVAALMFCSLFLSGVSLFLQHGIMLSTKDMKMAVRVLSIYQESS